MKIHPLLDGVHLLDFGMVNAYLCVERDALTLIDAGLAGQTDSILSAIEELGRKPSDLRQIVATHCHADHVGDAGALAAATGARLLVHAADAAVVRGHAATPAPDLTDDERPLHERIAPSVPAAPAAPVDEELRDGAELELFGRSSIVAVPGHTAGSIAIHAPARRLLFTGDAAVGFDGKPITGVFNVDREAAGRSFARMAELDFGVACFGHGAPLLADAAAAFRRAAEPSEMPAREDC